MGTADARRFGQTNKEINIYNAVANYDFQDGLKLPVHKIP